MFPKKYMLLAALTICSIGASAQKEITFGADNRSSHARHKRYNRGGDAKNSVSLGIVSWISGYTPVYYERLVAPILSVQGGIGFTSRNFTYITDDLFDFGTPSDNFSGPNQIDILDHYDNYKYRKTMPGIYLSISPKIYYTEDGMDGPYIAPMLELKQYRWKARMLDESPGLVTSTSGDDFDIPHSTATMTESMRCLDLTVNFGGHYQAGSHLVIGWSTGIGVRNAHNSRLDLGITSDGMGGNAHYVNAVQEFDKTKVLFTFQFIVGGWF